MLVFRRALVATLLLCLGCAAQSTSPEINQRIEKQVRANLQLPPSVDVTVLDRKPTSEFANYDTVTVQLSQGSRKATINYLVSKDNKTLLHVTRMDLSKDPYAELMSKIDLAGRPVLGNRNAKVTIVSYDDFECPFCARMHQELMQDIAKNYGDRVRIIYKDFPLAEIHPWAMHAAVDANCLAAQNSDAYWDFANTVHANQGSITAGGRSLSESFQALDKITTEIGQKRNLQLTPLLSCIKAQNTDAIKASMQEGDSMGITATPVLFVNGERVDGAVPAADVRAAVDRALQAVGESVPAAATAASAGNK